MNSFRVGTVLATALRVIGRHFLLFAALTALTSLPWALLMFENPVFAGEIGGRASDPDESGWILGQYMVAAILFPFVLAAMLGGAVSFVTVNHLRGERVSAFAALQQTVRPLVRVLLTNFLVWLRIMLWMLPVFVAAPLLLASGSPEGFTVLVLFALGGGALVFAVITYTKLWVAVPAAVVEGLGPIAACRRSDELTRGSRAGIFGVSLLVFAMLWILGLIVGVAVQDLSHDAQLWLSLAQTGIGCVMTSALAAAGYFAIRQGREVLDLRAAAAVFG